MAGITNNVAYIRSFRCFHSERVRRSLLCKVNCLLIQIQIHSITQLCGPDISYEFKMV